MNWKEHVTTFDSDTVRVLEIAEHFLVLYFGHSQERAGELMAKFFELHAKRCDEDLVHHESAYRIAALIHYVQALGGDIDAAAEWIVDHGHNNPPKEALEYFREHYFTRQG